MFSLRLAAPLCALTVLLGCEAKFGDRAESEGPANGSAASAEGKARDGEFSIKAPGFDMKIDIPKGLAERMDVESRNDVLYPGAKLSGLNIDANDDGGTDNKVELRFTSADAPAKVAGWYQDAARAPRLTIASAARDGAGYRIEARDEDGDPLTVRLAPGAGGGTEGQLLLRDKK